MKKMICFLPLIILIFGACANDADNSNMEISSRHMQESVIEDEDGTTRTMQGTGQYGRGALSDGADTNSEEAPLGVLSDANEALVIYFSRSGNTENLAVFIHEYSATDIFELTVLDPYPSDYDATVARANKERDNSQFPALDTEMPDFDQYDQIFLGTPIWGMTLANPICRFLEDYGEHLDGKEIVPFFTHAGFGEGNSIAHIKALVPTIDLLPSFSIED